MNKIPAVIVLLSTLIFFACKDDNSYINSIAQDKVTLTINPSIIELVDYTPKSEKNQKEDLISNTKNNSKTSNLNNDQSSQLISGQNFDILATLPHNNDESFSRLDKGDSQKKDLYAQTNSSKLSNNIKFILQIFEDDNGDRGSQLGSNYEFTVNGTNPTIEVDSERDYHWIAFSTNETSLPVINGNTVASSDAANKDILYDSGTISTIVGNNMLNIQFEHKASRVEVTFDSRGMQMPFIPGMPALTNPMSANVGILSTGFTSKIYARSFDLNTGEYTGTSTALNDLEFNNNNATRNSILKAIFHSAETIEITDNNLVVKLTNPAFYPHHTGIPFIFEGSSNISLPNQLLTVNEGERYLVNIELIQSGINIDNVLWARYPLSLRDDYADLNPLRFLQPLAIYTYRNYNPSRDYFRWNAISPTDDANNTVDYDASKDPCMHLFPSGTWRLPSQSEAETLVSKVIDNESIIYQDLNGPRPANDFSLSIGHNRDNHQTLPATQGYAYPQKDAFVLYFTGYRVANYSLATSPNAPFPDYIKEFHHEVSKSTLDQYGEVSIGFWTDQPGITTGTAKAYVRKATFTNDNGVTNYSIGTASIVDVDRSIGLSIRCVRNSA